jgi:hypothetical protein
VFYVFNTRIIFGTIATAGLFAATAAAPAMATTAGHPKTDHARPVSATRPVALGGVPLPVPGMSEPGSLSPVTAPLQGPLCPLLGWMPVIGSLLNCGGDMSGAPAMGNPLGGVVGGVSGAVNGVTGALGGATGALGGADNATPGLGGVTGAVNGVLKGVTGAVNKLPVVGGVADNVANTAQGALGGVTGALNGVTSLVPGLGSLSGLEHAAPLGH